MSSYSRLTNTLKLAAALSLSFLAAGQSSSQDADKQIALSAEFFKCLTQMTKAVSGSFFVDNLLGDVEGTLAVANSETGGQYPPGSVISLIPTEVMVKHQPGWNAGTNDWEFIELTVDETGSAFAVRGTTEVVNRFGGNCFGCHQLARPEWDLICGTDHGCAPLPFTRETLMGIQNSDPRCRQDN